MDRYKIQFHFQTALMNIFIETFLKGMLYRVELSRNGKKFHLFDNLISHGLLHRWELGENEELDRNEIFHRNVLRQLKKMRKSGSNAMVYESSLHETELSEYGYCSCGSCNVCNVLLQK